MKYIFFGSPEFARLILERLIATSLTPAAVVCNPDRPFGRKKILTPPPVKELVVDYNLKNKDKIRIFQPENLSNFKFEISNFEIDAFVVAAYAKIIPKDILNVPRLGTIGVHPSLLPRFRGASPVQSAILSGERETGTTLFLMDEKMDHGPILASEKINIPESVAYPELERTLARLSADILIQTIPDFLRGEIVQQPQDEEKATYTKKFVTDDGFIDLERDSAELIMRKVNALNPSPGVWIMRSEKRVKLLEAKRKGKDIFITRIQPEGKKPQKTNLQLAIND